MLVKLFSLGVHQRKTVLLGVGLVTAFFITGLPGLQINTGLDSLVPANNPDRLVYQRVLEEFGTDNKTIIYVRDANLWSPGKLAGLERLHYAIEKINGVNRVDSLFNLRSLIRNGDSVDAGPVIGELPDTAEQALDLRERVLQNPLYTGEYFSSDGQVTAMMVSIDNSRPDSEAGERIYREIEALLVAQRAGFTSLFQTGQPRLDAELRTNLYKDFVLLGPLSALILILSILVFIRSWLAATIPLLTSLITITWTFGMLAWTGVPVNILSATLPSLIIVVAATTNIHLIISYLRGLEKTGSHNHPELVQLIARQCGLPLLFTLLTMTLGFASNIFNNIDLIRGFALASAFAILANGIVTVLLAPVLLSLFARSPRRFIEERNHPDRFPGRVLRVFRYSRDRYPRGILLVTALLCIFFFYHASTLYVTNDPISYFTADHPMVDDINHVHEDLAGVNLFFITLESNTERTFLEPRNIEKLAEIQAFVREQGVFDQSRSFADYLAYVHREIQGDQPGLSLPRTRQLVAQYMLLFHRADIDSYVSHDYSRANIIVRHNINDSHMLNEYVSELRNVVDHIAGAELAAHIVGQNLMVNHAAESLKTAQVNALLVLLALVFIIVSILFTSIKGGLVALVPALIPIALMFGVMGLLGIPLNPGTAMVAVIAIGLAVDGTIHLLTRYNELCRQTSDYAGAVHGAVTEVAPPLIISSLALSLGFSVLVFSNFTMVAQFGALVTATMLFSIFANLMITPLIMTKIRLIGLYQILTMSLDDDAFAKCSLFRDMTEYQRRKAILISELREFKQGELLIEQDTLGRSMYLILTGRAEVVRRDGGQAHLLATLEAGQVFGEIGYIRETKRTADVRAKTDITALRFDYERLQKDLKYFPNIVAKLNFNISYILGKRLADMVEQSKN